MPNLNVAKFRNARHPGGDVTRPICHYDGAGLYLQITVSNAKSWLYRFRRHGKAREMGLGHADPDGRSGLSLADARLVAAQARKLVAASIDPIAERDRIAREQEEAERRGKAQTFRKATQGCIEAKRPGWKSVKHAKQWETTLQDYAFPILGNKDVAAITVDDVLAVLKPIWGKIPETASRVRQRVEAVLDYAAAPARKWRSTENPARWRAVLEHELPKKSKVRAVRHHPSLSPDEINAFVSALRQHDGTAALALEFGILTACRSNEILGAIWSEISLEKRIWTIPAERMKGGRAHRVPLSPAAVEALWTAKERYYGWKCSLVFPSSQTGTKLSDMALSELVRGMSWDGLEPDALPRWRDDENRAAVPHGFRTTFKSWARTSGFEDHLSEIALAHVDKDKTRAAYARHDLVEERRPMMERWAQYCTAPAATVTPLKAVRGC